MDTDVPHSAGSSGLRSSRSLTGPLAWLLLGTAVLVGAYASFMVPLLRAGLADAPMVTLRDSSALYGDFAAGSGLATVPEPLATAVYLLWFATIAFAPLAGAAGAVVGGWLVAREVAARRPGRAAAALLTCVGCATVLAVALSPWGRTAKAWFLD